MAKPIMNKSNTAYFAGVDPGKSGATVVLDSAGNVYRVIRHDIPIRDIVDALLKIKIVDALLGYNYINTRIVVYIEQVHAFPAQGVSSTFKFGKQYGFMIGVMSTLGFPLYYVTPQTWQKNMGCLTGGDKNVTKRKAQELFPEQKIIHATADAFLIAEYGRRDFLDIFC